MLSTHLTEIQNAPFRVGQKVRVKDEDGQGEIHNICGATYDYRPGAWHRGWNFHLATDEEIENGYGGADGFRPEDIELA